MKDIKSYFKENEWDMISHIERHGKTSSWLVFADIYYIKSSGTPDQRRKAANDIYRKYQKLMSKSIEPIETTENIKTPIQPAKILIYDIETARMRADIWWSGKQYINGNALTTEPAIITVAYKWFGSDEVKYLTWNKGCDLFLMQDFLKEYNQADIVLGFNNNSFDNKYINSRALKHNLYVNTHVKSLDLMRQCKSLFRLPSYSLSYIARYLGLAGKMKHSGLDMWEAIQYGKKKEAKKAMKEMVKYNIQDIIVTENVYLILKKYLKHPIHAGVLNNKPATTCPVCTSNDLSLLKTTSTPAGTIQRIMKCNHDNYTFKITNSAYLKIVEEQNI